MMLFDVAQEVIRELRFVSKLQPVQHLFHVFADSRCRNACFHPVVHAECGQLTLQNSRCVQEHTWSLYLPLHHFQRFFKEELIVRVPLSHRNVKRIAVFTPGTTNTL